MSQQQTTKDIMAQTNMAWPNIYGIDSSQFIQQQSDPRQPTVFLIHDSFVTPAHLAPLHNELLRSQQRVYSPHLPSTGFEYQPDVIEADVQVIIDGAKPELRTGRDIVFVMFGYGAVPGSIAAERLNKWSLEVPRAGQISKFVFISAILLNKNEAVKDVVVVNSEKYELNADRMCRLKEAEKRFLFEPCSSQVMVTALRNLQYFNTGALSTAVTSRSWHRIPSLYVICEHDRSLVPTTQECFAARLQASNSHSAVMRFPAGHSPYLTHTAQTAALISRMTRPPSQ